MPLTTSGANAPVLPAVLNGSILSPAWWRAAVPASPALLHVAMAGLLGGQALWLLRLLVSCVFPLVLSPFSMWMRVYAVGFVMLIMYSMNSPVWRYPHVGFLALFYLIYAFWTLPNVQPIAGHKMS